MLASKLPGGGRGASSPVLSRPSLLALRLACLACLAFTIRQPLSHQAVGAAAGAGNPLLLELERSPPRASLRSRRLLQDLAPPPPEPPEPEMASRAEAVFLPPADASEAGGSVLLPGLAPLGTQLKSASDNVQPTVAACTAACREVEQCTAFWYCERQGGCVDATYNLSSPLGGCQLVRQEETVPGTGRPPLLVRVPAFTGGAPLRLAAVQIEGYDAYPGLGFWYRFDYPCADSVSQPDSCGLDGGPADQAARCDADPACSVMMDFPDGRDYPGAGRPVVLLKGGNPSKPPGLADANVNLNAVLYQKQKPTSSGGLSGSAIAGIVVSMCICVVAAGTLAITVHTRHLRAEKTLSLQSSKASEQTSPASVPPSSSAARGSQGGDWRDGSQYGSALGAGISISGGQGGFSRLDAPVEASGPTISEAARAYAAWQEASTMSGLLPRGQEDSEAAAGSGPGSSGMGKRLAEAGLFPMAPPPSVTNSMAVVGDGSGGSPAAGQPPGSSPSGVLAVLASPPAPAGQASPLPAGAPACAAGPVRGAAVAHHPLLSQLPTYGWQRSLVEHAAIQFERRPDGGLVELGAGASATVYRVLLNGVEPHAAKVFRLGADPQAQLCFLEEAGLLRLLRHRAIVGFAGVTVAGSEGIILMELMEGGDLRARNAERDPATGARLFGWYQRGRRVALDVACALLYLHTSSYTHFDIKSRNVLLSRDLTAKVADVGFTRAMRATHHSVEGPTGTFDYMAPELLTGRKCTNSVDIYSFGALLWELCTGLYPTRGDMREPQVPLECPLEVAQLMAACLQEDPTARPTARQIVELLTQLQ